MSGENKSLSDIVRSTRAKVTTSLRVDYTFRFRDPSQRKLRTAGSSIDVPSNLSAGDVKRLIRQSITEWWDTHYRERGGGRPGGRSPFQDVTIKAIEGM